MTMSRRAALTAALFSAAALAAVSASAADEPKIGAAAPAFQSVDSNGKPVALTDFKGKTIVLEWTNDGCPFVKKHYGAQNMQALQKKWTGKDVVWLSIISSPPGEQGFATGPEANKLTADRGAAPSAVLLDPKGEIGRIYRAQTTPHMFVIKPDGVLAFMGGIDDKPSTRAEDVKTAKNFVDEALDEVTSGKAVSTPTARPYGCTIKYTS